LTQQNQSLGTGFVDEIMNLYQINFLIKATSTPRLAKPYVTLISNRDCTPCHYFPTKY